MDFKGKSVVSKLNLKNEIKSFTTSSSSASDATNRSSLNLKTWQIALAIGIPSAVIIAYLMYRRRRGGKSSGSSSGGGSTEATAGKPSTTTTTTQKGDNTATTDAKKNDGNDVKKSPLEQAIDFKNDGNKFFQQKKYKEALECYSKAIELCPKDNKDELPKFYQNRAASYENLKKYENVIEDCDRALELDPNYTKALLRRAKAAELIENYQMAFEDLTALCILENFSNEKNILYADKLVKKLGERMCKEKFSERKFVPISKHFVNNFYIGLMNDPIFNNQVLFDEIKASENQDDVKHISNALNEFNIGSYDACIEHCTNEINENGRHKNEALNLRGSLYMLRCQFDESIKDFSQLLASSSATNRLKSNTLIKMTALNLQRNEEEEAMVNYDKAVKLDPTNEDIYCNRAQVLAMKGRFEESFRDFAKSIELNPSHKIANLQKAFFEFRKFNYELQLREGGFGEEVELSAKAKRELDNETRRLEPLLEQYSDVPEAYSLFAQILSEQKNYEKAERFYKDALEKDPMNAALIVQRALNYMQLHNEFDVTIQMLNEAIQIDETCEFAYETLASIEIQRGNLIRAIELFSKAINLTRNEVSMLNLCSMLIGAQTQYKILHKFSDQAFNIVNLAGKN